jgi:SAM-dependent methyltransferase
MGQFLERETFDYLQKMDSPKTTIYIGQGEVINLTNSDEIFLPSPAGLFLWETLNFNKNFDLGKNDKILDLGCGSGFIAICFGLMNYKNIYASDINKSYVDYAKSHFEMNVSHSEIDRFFVSDLFDDLPFGGFNLIVFNCPGWATPNPNYQSYIREISGNQYYSMFEGDRIAMSCVQKAADFLRDNGSLVIGLNSIGNMKAVLEEVRSNDRLQIRSLAKCEFPLFLYNTMWGKHHEIIFRQLEEWKTSGVSYFRLEEDKIFWSYEIIELKKKV